MNQAELFELMERFDQSGIAELCYRQGDERITLRKAVAVAPAPVVAAPVMTAPAVPAASALPAAGPIVAPLGKQIKAPLVGTFYTSSAPDAAAFAPVGKKLKKGETVCVIEAMKMINEIPAPCDCVIKEVLAENGGLVGFDDPLFCIEEC